MTFSSGTPPSLPPAIEDAVLAILDGEDDGRDAALAALLAAHPEHAPVIRAWLAAAGVAGMAARGTLLGQLSATSGSEDPLPQRLGAYELLAVIGRGGFGTVYRARQLEPIQRPVAVKVLNPGMDSREVVARFTAEREALNRMDHPGIARLLDAGTTPRGRPYFVMEFVDGQPLAGYCRRHGVPLRRRLELFVQICEAVQHAHQKGVLHRDLSSNNVLLADPDGRPQPKIIDFGIAKSLAAPLLQGGARTFQGTLMGTPEFMSPEQAAGRTDDVDTRADVYALGVQLYELLTDQLPIPGVVLRAQGLAGMAHIVASHVPPPPSEVAAPPLRARLRGDLDAIVRTALAKDREDRYPSVGELAADVRRHLADEPVQVATPTTFYRLRKFVRRYRAPAVAVAAAAVILLGAVVVMAAALRFAAEQAAAAQRAYDRAAAMADAGFRLLGNEELLREAADAELALPPPWPRHARAYAAWFERYGPLAEEHHKVTARLAELDGRERDAGGRLPDQQDRTLQAALRRIAVDFEALLGPGGAFARARHRQQVLNAVTAPALARHEAEWSAAAQAIRRSDGVVASAAYRGQRLEPLPGLVPLGADPATLLFEFLDLATHPPGAPLPARDPATGRLPAGVDAGLVFVLLPAAQFQPGARRDQPGLLRYDPWAQDDELGSGTVRLDEFLIARTELTAAQWARLNSREPPAGDPLLPQTGVDWLAATRALACWGLALPTEAQWEYACRGDTTTPWCNGADPAQVPVHGWIDGACHPVGALRPNAFGLYDLHGNAAEWCADELLPYTLFAARAGDGLRSRPVPERDAPRVVRGGAAHQGPFAARATARAGRPPDTRDAALGLRPVRAVAAR